MARTHKASRPLQGSVFFGTQRSPARGGQAFGTLERRVHARCVGDSPATVWRQVTAPDVSHVHDKPSPPLSTYHSQPAGGELAWALQLNLQFSATLFFLQPLAFAAFFRHFRFSHFPGVSKHVDVGRPLKCGMKQGIEPPSHALPYIGLHVFLKLASSFMHM